jgi:hypothetical protein
VPRRLIEAHVLHRCTDFVVLPVPSTLSLGPMVRPEGHNRCETNNGERFRPSVPPIARRTAASGLVAWNRVVGGYRSVIVDV